MENESIVKKINKCFANYPENEWIYDSFFAKLAGELSQVTKIPKDEIEDDIFRSSSTLMHAGYAIKPDGRKRLLEKIISRIEDMKTNLHPWLDEPDKPGKWRVKSMIGGEECIQDLSWPEGSETMVLHGFRIRVQSIKAAFSDAKFQLIDAEELKEKEAQKPEQAPEDENLDLLVWLAMGGVVLRDPDNETIPNGPHLYAYHGAWRYAFSDRLIDEPWQPRKNWAQLGPLLDRFDVCFLDMKTADSSVVSYIVGRIEDTYSSGKNRAEAACRAIAATYKPERNNEE